MPSVFGLDLKPFMEESGMLPGSVFAALRAWESLEFWICTNKGLLLDRGENGSSELSARVIGKA